MNHQRLLQINIATLAALGTLLLGMGHQQSLVLPIVTMLAAVTAVAFTDILRWFRLNGHVANLAAIGAVVAALRDVPRGDSQDQLLAIANLLVYLQIILLYQKKNDRIYYQLIILSLLQVVVATALYLPFQFGLLLAVYMFVAISALSLMCVRREAARFQNGDPSLGGGPSAACLFAPAMRARDDLARSMLGWGLARLVVQMGITTLIVAALVFAAVPRLHSSAWQGFDGGSRAMIGFSQEVSLKKMGRVLRSKTPVMRASFHDYHNDSPYSLVSAPYLRGVVLSRYDSGKSHWTGGEHFPRHRRLASPPRSQWLVRQQIVLQSSQAVLNSSQQPILFSVAPAYRAAAMPQGVHLDRYTHQLVYEDADQLHQHEQFHYALTTSAFCDGWQIPLRAHAGPRLGAHAREKLLALPEPEAGQRDKLSRLKQLAADILRQAKLDPDDRIARARALEAHFRTPGEYQYSLSAGAAPAGVDAIEHFVAERKVGHCEYFASALALMLRSQGIPARLVVGYKGGQMNSVGGYYQILQEDAHAWVEAYLEPEQIPNSGQLPVESMERGAWLRLDPTPGSDAPQSVAVGMSALARLGDLAEYLQMLWDDYVLGLDAERQRESIYRPLLDRASAAVKNIFNLEAWHGLTSGILLWLNTYGSTWLAGSWFHWRAGLTTVAGCLVVLGLIRLLAPTLRWLAGEVGTRVRQSRVRRRRRVDFYLRLEALLARAGLARHSGQTPRELAAAAAGLLAESSTHSHTARLPSRIVEAFYQVRFGGRRLDPHQAEAVQQALTELTAALADKRSTV